MRRALLFLPFLAAAALADAPRDLGRLIQQLGSPIFEERDAAQKALDALGEPALGALRAAADASDDLETRRRADTLARTISARLFPNPGKADRKFVGHTDRVNGVAFAPDGRRALSASRDGTVRLWDVAAGRELKRWTHHAGKPVWSVAFAPDGRHALSGGVDGATCVWDVESAAGPRRFAASDHPVLAVAFAPGRRAVAGADALRVWDLDAGKAAAAFGVPRQSVWGLALSADGKTALTRSVDGGDDNRLVRVWDVPAARRARDLAGHDGNVLCVAVSPDGTRGLSGADDRTLRLWDVAGGRELACIEAHAGPVGAAAFTPDGRWALSGGSDCVLRLWELKTGVELRRYEGHADYVAAVAVSPDGRFALSAGGNVLHLWRLPR